MPPAWPPRAPTTGVFVGPTENETSAPSSAPVAVTPEAIVSVKALLARHE